MYKHGSSRVVFASIIIDFIQLGHRPGPNNILIELTIFQKHNMKPTLYVDDRSPPVRSILMLIEELQLDVEIEFIDLFKQEHLKPTYLQVRIYLLFCKF